MSSVFRLFVAVAFLLLSAAPASAGTVPINAFHRPGDLHLDFPRYTSSDEWSAPQAVTRPVGDVNGDGRADIAMALTADSSGTTWVTFNPGPQSQPLAVEDPTWPGMRISTAGPVRGVAGVGDLDGDGLGDVAVATDDAVYVVFGSPTPGAVDAANLGSRGFTLTGVTPCFLSSMGNLYTGVFSRGSSVGRIDGGLAICTDVAILSFHPPADAAGRSFDLSAPRSDTGRLTLPDGLRPSFGTQSNGRLVVAWATDGTGYILETDPPAAGTTTTLAAAQDAPESAVLELPVSYFEQATPMRDANGDGRGDVALSVVASTRERMIAFTPAPGRHETVSAANSRAADTTYSGITDVGDQDGDGRPDLANDPIVALSAGGSMSIDQSLPTCVPLKPLPGGSLVLCSLEYKIADSMPDMNGDGKPEMIAIYADPLPVEDDKVNTTWHLDVFLSAPRPAAGVVEAPVQDASGVAFAGTFITAPGGPIRTLGARATVAVIDPAGRSRTVSGDVIDAGAATTTRVVLRATAAQLGLVPGTTYTYRLSLENGRGLTAAARPQTFVFGRVAAAPLVGSNTSPMFNTSPKSLRVSKTGRFTYKSTATPLKQGKLGFKSTKKVKIGSNKRFMTVAKKSFTVPASAKVKVKFKLSKENLEALKKKRTIRFKVTATLSGKTFTTELTLKAPKKH